MITTSSSRRHVLQPELFNRPEGNRHRYGKKNDMLSTMVLSSMNGCAPTLIKKIFFTFPKIFVTGMNHMSSPFTSIQQRIFRFVFFIVYNESFCFIVN